MKELKSEIVYKVLKPPPEAFKYRGKAEAVNHSPFGIVENVSYPETGGMLIHKAGMKYPEKGIAYPEAIAAVNIVKALIVAELKSASVLDLFRWRKKLKELERPCFIALENHIISWWYLCPTARNVYNITEKFLAQIGIENSKWPDIIAAIFEEDDAYRAILQDIANEMINPTLKDLLRALKLAGQRISTDENSRAKMRRFYQLLTLLSYSPLRKAIQNALREAGIDGMKPDSADQYHMLYRSFYEFFGIKLESRMKAFNRINGGSIGVAVRVPYDDE